MAVRREPAFRTPALDFCLLVSDKQRSDLSLAVPLDEDTTALLERLVREAGNGATPNLEGQARQFLIVYQEREKFSRVLDDEERVRLNQIVEGYDYEPPLRRTPRELWPSNVRLRVVLIVIAVLAVLAGIVGTVIYVNRDQSGPPAGAAPQYPPGPVVVPPADSDLQNFKQEWGPWKQLTPSDARPQTGQPALLLLESGIDYASVQWTIPTDSSVWHLDLGGNLSSVVVNGNHADITDVYGLPYIVGINQPFVVASDPGTVLRVDPTGKVYSMNRADATAVRQDMKGK